VTGFDLQTYLDRIGLTGPVRPDLDTLRAIHTAHAGAIPFENLDIQADPPRPIRVDLDGVFAKLVTARRGGYCFEQNTLLGAALTAIGFQVRRCLARVVWSDPANPGARTHLILMVTLDGVDWIADCGFGGFGLTTPLRVAPGEVQDMYGEDWRVVEGTRLPGLEIQVHTEGAWRPAYVVDPREPVLDADIVIANHFTESFPESRFVQYRILARNTPGVRRSILNDELKIRRDGGVTTQRIADDAAFRAILAEHFALELPDGFRLRPCPVTPS